MKTIYEVRANDTAIEVDSAEPDYEMPCLSCGVDPNIQPTVTLWRHGRMIHHTHLCGPCTWGEARMVDPRNWND
jgi:hypothetical protein